MGHLKLSVMVAACIGSVVMVSAQNPDASARFEVASVRPNTSRDARPNVEPTPGRFTATAVTPRELIGMAYAVPGSIRPIVGGPDWLDTDRFDIVATGGPTDPNIRRAPDAVSPREGAALNTLQAMLRQLLRDRFALSRVWAAALRRTCSHASIPLSRVRDRASAPRQRDQGTDMRGVQ